MTWKAGSRRAGLRAFWAVGLAGLLGGCLFTERPAVQQGQAAFPVPDGIYLACDARQGSVDRDSCEHVGLRRSAEGYRSYDYNTDQHAFVRGMSGILAVPLKGYEGRVYLVQIEAAERQYGYSLAIVHDNGFRLLVPRCSDMSAASRGRLLGAKALLEVSGEGESLSCTVPPRREVLARLLTGWRELTGSPMPLETVYYAR